MNKWIVLGFLVLTTAQTQAQTDEDFLSGFTVKAKIEKPVGSVFESGAVLCAPQTPQQTYNYGYTFKIRPDLEVIEFQVDKKTDGPEGIIPLREESPNYQSGALRINPSSVHISEKTIKFSGESLDFAFEGNTISLAPVATVSGTLSLNEMKLSIHVVGSFTQDVEMKCSRMK
jgi:hypothetical protein